MTDVPPEPAPTAVPPEVQAALDQIKAENDAADAAAAAAQEAEDARLAKLDEVKARANAAVAPISEALANTTEERSRQALIDLEEQTMAPFREELEAAYAEFAQAGPTNPAEGVTEIDAGVTAAGGATG